MVGSGALTTMPGAVFMQALGSRNDHDLGLFSVGQGAAHFQRDVGPWASALPGMGSRDPEPPGKPGSELSIRGALVGASDHGSTKAPYARDPDNLEFEVSWLVRSAPRADPGRSDYPATGLRCRVRRTDGTDGPPRGGPIRSPC